MWEGPGPFMVVLSLGALPRCFAGQGDQQEKETLWAFPQFSWSSWLPENFPEPQESSLEKSRKRLFGVRPIFSLFRSPDKAKDRPQRNFVPSSPRAFVSSLNQGKNRLGGMLGNLGITVSLSRQF